MHREDDGFVRPLLGYFRRQIFVTSSNVSLRWLLMLLPNPSNALICSLWKRGTPTSGKKRLKMRNPNLRMEKRLKMRNPNLRIKEAEKGEPLPQNKRGNTFILEEFRHEKRKQCSKIIKVQHN
jgi:hypothetical protein